MPPRVTISEVSLRDGLQIEPIEAPTGTKIALAAELARAGITRIEVTGFVHPKVVPQFADAEAVLAGLARAPGVRHAAFVPNGRGAERAVAAGVDDLKCGVAASDSFNALNVRMTTEQGLRAVDDIARAAAGTAARIVGVVATAFGCPYEGPVDPACVDRLFAQMLELGAPVIYLADTTGMADPGTIHSTVQRLQHRWPDARIGLHLHNTRGLGIANALAGLKCGVSDFEASVGGLGGCPFAPRAVGNVCTEDLVHMLRAMGIETGTDLDALIAAAAQAQEAVGRVLPGMVLKAGKVTEGIQ
ncbi:hydroxymethylglutaryl-CoA lyase [Muricoccus aerilatus]|uniref:hydroxymethylglutaryl-CoA lyase n=1 Tax=Muricoccus aerilatus TaxID=452982 RepID=UPI0005C25630|nr:hydroxymethylglutaryl-CoA lyase [Roseomonas aerilata]